MSSNKPQQQPQVIIVKQESPWLRRLVMFLLFGWFYVAWAVLKWLVMICLWPFKMAAKVGWVTMFEWPWKATVAATRWTVRMVQDMTTKGH